MRRTEPIRFGDAWDEFLKSSPNIARKIASAKIPDVWRDIAGQKISNYTREIKVENGVMTICITSSVLRNELFMKRDTIKEHVNKFMGMQVVNIVLIKA